MCELFGTCSREPSVTRFAREEFIRHGGASAPNEHGWGIAYFEEPDAVVLRVAEAAARSELARFMETHEPATNIMISHVRWATRGQPALRNTHPFSRELAGRAHCFAHNGSLTGLPGLRERYGGADRYRPIGDTDSEHAFCLLLERMRPLWKNGDAGLHEQVDVFAAFAAEMRELGAANFLYSDGRRLFAHSHQRMAADGTRQHPGLHMLRRELESGRPFETSGLGVSGSKSSLCLVASVPLSEERWEPIREGSVVAIENGVIAASA